ncbi:MAG: SRPBCC domain-containing protein, partial [Spirochaetia bacterium]|nr:SRPBCC domain-containing protein [Spirochaetia bacterium]
LPHKPKKIWRALTEPGLLAQWLMETDLKPVVGHRFTFRRPPVGSWDGIVHCEILEAVEGERLSYTWTSGELDTVVSWTLKASASGGTSLILEHGGFKPLSVLHPFRALAYYGARSGWKGMVDKKLRVVLGTLD